MSFKGKVVSEKQKWNVFLCIFFLIFSFQFKNNNRYNFEICYRCKLQFKLYPFILIFVRFRAFV